MSKPGKKVRTKVICEAMERRMMLSGAAPVITAPEIFGVRPGSPFLFDVTAAGDHPMTFGAVGLPAGLTLNPQTGMITGTLGSNATYDLTLTAANDAGAAQQKFRIVVGNKIELTPVMGWNSWNVYQGNVTQAEVTAQANAMAGSGLENYGWDYVNIDDGWEGGRVVPGSPIQSDPTVFPSIPALSSLIHSLGLKFGLYSVPQGTGYAHKAAGTSGQNTLPDALQMAAWGVDYFKYDGGPPTQAQIAELSQAFQASGRDIVLSASYFSGFSTANGNATFLPEWTNSWRVNGDITDFFTTVLNAGIADEQPWLNYSGPGHWLDPDALEIGYVGNGQAPHPSGMTQNQQQSQLTLWAMDAAPLLLGSDLTQLNPATMSILTDPEVIAVDQDPLGIQSRAVNGNTSIQSRPLADGSTAVELLNWNTGPVTMSVNFSDLGINGPQVVRDLLAEQNVGTFNGSYTVTVQGGATALIKLSAATPGAPQISGQPVNQEVNVGGAATFSVAAAGGDVLSYQWTENGVNIASANSATYTTPSTTEADNGAAFRCIVTNDIGKIISYEADLTVHGLTMPLTSTSYISATSGYYNNGVNLNANVLGYPLNINGTTFANGIGLQSPSEIDYFLNGQDSLFQTSVGIDNNGQGSVYFEVWLDGVEAYTTGLVTAHEAPIPISVNVSGARTLQLIVANGGTANASGNADWINPRVTGSLIAAGPQLPFVNSFSKSVQLNTAASFAAADFNAAFVEPNAGDSLQSIQITSLPANGTLLLGGSAVTAQQVIPVSQIGNLSYVPAANFSGNDSFGWLGTDQVGSAVLPALVNLTVQAVVQPPPPPVPVGTGVSFPNGFASAGNTLKLNGSANISNGTIVLTNNSPNNASSVYFTTPQNVAKFTTTFNFQITGTWPLGDGFTFVMQNAGLGALGPGGGGLGYGASQAGGAGGISSSVAVKFDVFYTSSGDGSVGVFAGGAFPGSDGADLGGSGFNLRSYDPSQATIAYDGTTLTVTLTDLTTKVSVSRSFAVNIPANVGGTSAYVGFTGGDGTLLSDQVIQNWTFTPGSTTPVVPAPQLPTVNNFSKTTMENSAVSFAAADFSAAFVEPNAGDSLQSIQITSLPGNGTLLLNNVAVSVNQVIPAGQIGNLTYMPASNYSGADSFGWLGTDQFGSAAASALVNLTVQPVVQPPGQPAGLTATAGNGQVVLAWNAVSGASGYVVSYGTANNGPYGTAAPAVATAGETIAGLTNGTTYYFVVAATNSGGTGVESAQASATPVAPTPPAGGGGSISFPSGFAAAGSAMKLNGSAKLSGGNLVLTDNGQNETSSVFFTTPQNVASFTTTFDFQITGTWPLGDGFTFVIQNAGVSALGAGGSGLGYGASQAGGGGGIPNSVAVKFDVLYTSSGDGSVGVYAGGAFPGSNGADLGGSGFNLRSYDPSQATIAYDGTTLTVTLTDLTTKASVSRSFAVNIPADVGAATAYVGFTGGDGALMADQVIQNWTFTPGSTTPIVPAPQLPTVNNFGKTTTENNAVSFAAADFLGAFVEPNAGDSLQSIQITSLPGNGALNLSGAAVTVGQVIAVADIGKLSYVPAANFSGNDSFGWLGTDQFGTAAGAALVNLSVQPVLAPPSAPTGLAPTAGNGQVALAWNAVSGASSYAVSYGTANNGPYATTAPAVATAGETITGLANGTTYYFVVTATTSGGTSGNSGQVAATPVAPVTPPAPPAPSGAVSFPSGFAGAGGALKLNGSAKISGANLVLTDNAKNEASSAFFAGLQNIGAFTTTFNFQLTGSWPLGDGFTFVIQNAGLAALGAGGSGLGYGASQAGGTGGIASSVAVKFDVFHTSSGDGAVGVFTDGAYPGGSGADLGGSGFNLRSYDASQAKIVYDGTTLTVTLTDLLTHATVSRSFAVNIPAIVGSGSAYVGFTGADGALTASQVIQNWTYVGVRAPANVSVVAGNGQAALAWNPVTGATSYNIRYGIISGGPYANVSAGILQTNDTILNLAGGTTYYFVVTAVNAAGESIGPAQVSGTA